MTIPEPIPPVVIQEFTCCMCSSKKVNASVVKMNWGNAVRITCAECSNPIAGLEITKGSFELTLESEKFKIDHELQELKHN